MQDATILFRFINAEGFLFQDLTELPLEVRKASNRQLKITFPNGNYLLFAHQETTYPLEVPLNQQILDVNSSYFNSLEALGFREGERSIYLSFDQIRELSEHSDVFFDSDDNPIAFTANFTTDGIYEVYHEFEVTRVYQQNDTPEDNVYSDTLTIFSTDFAQKLINDAINELFTMKCDEEASCGDICQQRCKITTAIIMEYSAIYEFNQGNLDSAQAKASSLYRILTEGEVSYKFNCSNE